jgi:DNA-binding SARP family transcriptional activator
MRTIGRRILLSLSAALLVAAVWLLAETRPPLPAATRLTSTGGADRLLGLIAWLGCLLLALGLLHRLARPSQPGGTVRAAPIPNLSRRRRAPRSRQAVNGGYSERAFPLIATAAAAAAADRSPPLGPAEKSAVSRPEQVTLATDSPEAGRAVISLLGPPSVNGTRERGRAPRGATRALLCYLALRPGGAHRDQIVEALWPQLTPEQARKRLWRAAADARAQLGEASLRRKGEHYQLDRNQVSVDLDRLEHVLSKLSSTDPNEQPPLLEQALALFRGEPLAGSDFPWAENERRRLQAIRLDLFERTGRALLAHGDAAAALSRAEQGLASEPYNEKLSRLGMQAEAALGLRTAVIHRYQRLREILDDQLGLEPHIETRRLYRRLLGQDHEHDPQPAAADGERARNVKSREPGGPRDLTRRLSH